jgi:ferredoxin--NADP+ reductase
VLRGFTEGAERDTPVEIHFHFNLTPVAFAGSEALRGVQFRSVVSQAVEIPAQLAVTCVGYESLACCTATPENGVFANINGKIADRLYVVGWAKRGPSGTIPTNRVEAQQVAQKIAQEVPSAGHPGTQALQHLLHERACCPVDYEGWRKIDAAELSRGGAERCRQKLCSTIAMLDAAHAGQLPQV